MVNAPTDFDHKVMFTIQQLADSAYGPEIAQTLEQSAGKSVSRGALYAALDRLERRGLVRGRIEAATDERGGFPRRRFEMTEAGAR